MNEVTWGNRGSTPLSVWGPGEAPPNQPSGTADLTSDVSNAFATNTHIRRDLVEHLPAGGIEFQTTEITSEGVVYQNNGVTVTVFLVDHGVVASIIRAILSRFPEIRRLRRIWSSTPKERTFWCMRCS
jgi:hypothetical protein